MVKCENGVVLLMSMIVMVHGGKKGTAIVEQNVDKLADADPFPNMRNIPSEFNFNDWNPEDPKQKEKLEELVLRGWSVLRRANNVTEDKLKFMHVISRVSNLRAHLLCDELVRQGDQYNPSTVGALFEFHKKGDKRKTWSTSEFVVSAMRDWYMDKKTKVENGQLKKAIIQGLDPRTKYVGLGICKGPRKETDSIYYVCVMDFANDNQIDSYNRYVQNNESKWMKWDFTFKSWFLPKKAVA